MVSLIAALRDARQAGRSERETIEEHRAAAPARTRRHHGLFAYLPAAVAASAIGLGVWWLALLHDLTTTRGLDSRAGTPLLIVSIGATVLLAISAAAIVTEAMRARGQSDSAVAAIRAALLLVFVGALAWIVWRDSGPWKFWIGVTGTLVLTVAELMRSSRGSPAEARGPIRTGNVGVPDRNALRVRRRMWRPVGTGSRPTILLLVLLNVAAALVLLSSPGEFSRLWALPTMLAFAFMLCVNIAALNVTLARAKSATPAASVRHSQPTDRVRPRVTNPAPARGPQPTHSDRSTDAKLRSRAAIVGIILATAWIAYAHPGAPLTLGVLVVGLAMPFTMDVDRRQAITMVLALAVGVAAVDYISWRVSVTNWAGWWISVPLLLAEALGALHVLGYQFTIWPRLAPSFNPTTDPTRRPVFVFIPTVNEGVTIVRGTLEACLAARKKYLEKYPAGNVTIVVCNDGRAAQTPEWEQIDELASELGVECVTRWKGGGAKAGNIENARQKVGAIGDALVVIFDADQVPEPEFFLETIPPFGDENVGWVQTGQYYANLKNPVSRWADDQQSMFYNVLCPGKETLNANFICGTNVAIRADALDEIGGLPQDSVTEDFAASIVLHRKWRSVYLSQVLATGLGPLDLPSYLRQQGRWARGTLGVLRTNWRDILLPRKNGLRAGQRAQYFLACTHYLCGLRDFIFMVSPILFIVTAIPAVRRASLTDYLWHFLPYGLLALAAMWYSARRVSGLRGIIVGFGSFPALIGSLVAVILRRKTSFIVTSKKARQHRSLRYLVIYVVMALLCVAALVFAVLATTVDRTSLFISALWIVYSLLLLSGFLGLAIADLRAQAAARRDEQEAKTVAKLPYKSKLLGRPSALRPALAVACGGLLASILFVSPPLNSLPEFERNAQPFALTPVPRAPYTGVSLPIQLIASQPEPLEAELGVHFSVVGRTQDINDRFDEEWADRLAANGTRPWITLEFGEAGPDGKIPLGATLPAIYNGVHDAALRRWAHEIRSFGRPVYITILEHADKDWSVSSGVAHGGIPEDVPKAWLHVQAVFRSAGAKNVAWVWAPADPVDDQRFAPPANTVDAVLQSFINYPGTRWGDPQHVLNGLVARYPGMPLFIETTVDGPPVQKAAWLERLVRAVDATPQAYALIYHEGGPDLAPSPAEIHSWSLASDPRSLAIMKFEFQTFDTERSSG
jgi:cellulose synthase/poly-beta-1,6-N-acetylglucosamine synthase-like glycosyltransferase